MTLAIFFPLSKQSIRHDEQSTKSTQEIKAAKIYNKICCV